MKLLNFKLLAFIVSSLLILSTFSCTKEELQSSTYSYDFNTGQVATTFAYAGTHADDLSATIKIDELEDGGSDVTITIMNTIDGEVYNTHAHDMADASTTPNGTPYNETPNADVFAMPLTGNGGSVSGTKTSTMSYEEITTTYDGFFVIHDPLQNLTTTDPTTYVILGVFAR